MSELKTLKDLNIIKGKVHALGGEVGVDELKAEARKWVEEDINDLDRLDELTAVEVIERWQKRLNISEEDLNDEIY